MTRTFTVKLNKVQEQILTELMAATGLNASQILRAGLALVYFVVHGAWPPGFGDQEQLGEALKRINKLIQELDAARPDPLQPSRLGTRRVAI